MADPTLIPRFGVPLRRLLAPGLLWTSILLLAGASSALAVPISGIHNLMLQFPSRVIVDKGMFEDGGNYLTMVDHFPVLFGTPTGSLTPLTVMDFFIASTTPSIGGEFFSFEIEDPSIPESFGFTQDLPFTWDMDTGGVFSNPFRVKLTFNSFGTELVSFYDLTLTTAGVPAIACPPEAGQQNTHGRLTGANLPPGDLPPAGEPLKLVAMACAIEAGGVTNDLPLVIPVVEINGILAPEPSTGLLLSFGMVGLAWAGRRQSL